MTTFIYPRLPKTLSWPVAQVAVSATDGIDLVEWLADRMSIALSISSVTASSTPGGITLGTPAISGTRITVSHTGGVAGVNYFILFRVVFSDASVKTFSVTLPIFKLQSQINAPTDAPGLATALTVLPATQPVTPATLWRSNGEFSLT